MQRVTRSLALVCLALMTAACMDQGRHVQTAAEIEASRREAVWEGRVQALEREHAFLMQQVATLSASTQNTMAQTSTKEDERDKRLAELSSQIAGVAHLISAWREEERPQPLDPEARRIAEQVSAEDRTAAIRKVQALLDAGRIKLTMRGGRIEIAQVRPIDATNPYESPAPKPAPPPTPAPTPRRTKQSFDRFGF